MGDEMVQLCQPNQVFWCDGSDEEYQALCDQMVSNGTLIKLDAKKRPGSFLARSHPSDVARLEDRTFICRPDKRGSRTTNNWSDPVAMKQTLLGKFQGSMRGARCM